MTSRRESLLAALEARIASVHAGTLRRDGRGDDDAPIPSGDLPAIVIAQRRDAPKSANEQSDRTLEVEMAFYTGGAMRVAASDALLCAVLPAVLAIGDDMPKTRIREGETTWEPDGSPEVPVLRTVVALSIGYRTNINSID